MKLHLHLHSLKLKMFTLVWALQLLDFIAWHGRSRPVMWTSSLSENEMLQIIAICYLSFCLLSASEIQFCVLFLLIR